MGDTVTIRREDLNALIVHSKIALSLIQRYEDVLTGSESQMTRAILPGVIEKAEKQLSS